MVHGVNNVTSADIQTTELLALQTSALEDEPATEKLRRHKSLGIREN
jgi:hypothetical protein